MSESWKQLQGQSVDNETPLVEYLGGSQDSAVFLTKLGGQEARKAAVKLVAAIPANAELQLIWWKHAEKLSHPHLIRVLRSGRCQLNGSEYLFLVMEYAEENLAQILPQRALTANEAREMLKPTLDALAYAHSQGLVHASLKPANIMAAGEQLKVSSDDFCPIGETMRHASAPTAYDPPEIGSTGTSLAANAWSLGMTLVEVLTQRPPVWERTGSTGPVIPDSLPAPFLEIARHCMARDPERRWTLSEISQQLQPVAAPAVAQPAPVAAAPRAVRNAPLAPVASKSRASNRKSSNRSYFVLAAIALVVGAILIIPRLSQHPPADQKDASVASQPASQPQAEQKSVPSEAKPSERSEPAESEPRTSSETVAPPTETASSDTEDTDVAQDSVRHLTATSSKESSKRPTPPVPAATATPTITAQDGIVHKVVPSVPQKARNTIQGKVRVKVKVNVNSSGDVVDSEFVSRGPSRYFANLAMEASRDWKFSSASSGKENSRAWTLDFIFRRAGTDVHPAQIAR
jgi:TonB family protein